MIEVRNVEAIRKGSLLALCDVYIAPWKLTLKEVKIFQKGANRWLGLPSKEYVLPDGSKKFVELIEFDSETIKNRFRSEIMPAIDKFLETNPDLTPDDVIKNEELPF